MPRIEKSPVQEWTFPRQRQNLQIKVICENEKIRGWQMRSCRAVTVDQKQAKRASQKFPILEEGDTENSPIFHIQFRVDPYWFQNICSKLSESLKEVLQRYNHYIQFNCGKSLLFNIWLDVMLLLNSDVTLRIESLQSLSACFLSLLLTAQTSALGNISSVFLVTFIKC